MTRIDVYPVGVLADIGRAWRYLTSRRFPATIGPPSWTWRLRNARSSLRHARRSVARHIRRRQWRDLKNDFNGFLAEPDPWPDGIGLTRCGSGWTRGRALRSLRRHGYREEAS